MQNKSSGLIIYIKPIKDNDLFIKILSIKDTIVSGIVYGGNSSKRKIIYQPGNFISFNGLQKNVNSIKTIEGEIISPYINNIYNDKFKTFSLIAIISLLNESLYEDEEIEGLYISVLDLIYFINKNEHWVLNFCEWLLIYLKLLGYEINYNYNHNMKYFNLSSLNFQKIYSNHNSILFPFELFKKNNNISYNSLKSFFIIFETVYKKNNLNHYNGEISINYINFKNLILNTLKNTK